ncbi:MAG: phenylalanine--tRNA ligase subunit beta [Nanoarchaeota archaeon]
MASVEVSKTELSRLIKRDIRLDYLVNRIGMLGMPVENVKEDNLALEVFPNRPDYLSQYGIARALRGFLGIKKGLVNYETRKSGYKVIVDSNLKNIRPFTSCCVIKNIKFSDEKIRDIIQFQEKLHITLCRNRRKAAIGIYPLDKIKFPIRFMAIAREAIKFKPLEHGTELSADEILKDIDAGKKYGHLINNLKFYPVFIDAKDNILSMPPVINSDSVGKITSKTTDVFIEVSGFDLNFLNQVLNIIATNMAEMGGKIYSVNAVYSGKGHLMPDLTPSKMKININYVNKLLGLRLKETQLKGFLEKMGYSYSRGIVSIPAYRQDILHEFDLVEDIAIAYGYENFSPLLDSFYSIAEEDKIEIFKEKMNDLLIGLEFIEVSMPHLSNKSSLNEKMNTGKGLIALKNSVNQEYNVLRNWLLPGLMEILSSNKHNEYPQKIFEIGTVFLQKNHEEKISFGGLISHSKANFTEAKQVIDCLLTTLNIKYEIKESDDEMCFIPGRAAKIMAKGKELGFLGEINPEVLEKWNLEQPTAGFEINFGELVEIIKI